MEKLKEISPQTQKTAPKKTSSEKPLRRAKTDAVVSSSQEKEKTQTSITQPQTQKKKSLPQSAQKKSSKISGSSQSLQKASSKASGKKKKSEETSQKKKSSSDVRCKRKTKQENIQRGEMQHPSAQLSKHPDTQTSKNSDTQPSKVQHSDTHHNYELGIRGENAAVKFLKNKGYEILERRWECPGGEADIIARYNNDIHFIEVKTRMSTHMGFPAEAVDKRKRERYERIAEFYLSNYEGAEGRLMFDIISILVVSDHRAFLKFHQNAYVTGE